MKGGGRKAAEDNVPHKTGGISVVTTLHGLLRRKSLLQTSTCPWMRVIPAEQRYK